VDRSANGLSGATVKLVARNLSTATDTGGYFTISGNAATMGGQLRASHPAPSLGNGVLHISLTKTQRVAVSLYDLRGCRIWSTNKVLEPGNHDITTPTQTAGAQLLLVKAVIGDERYQFTYSNVLRNAPGRHGQQATGGLVGQSGLAKTQATVDSLAASLFGYVRAAIPIDSFAGNYTITLDRDTVTRAVPLAANRITTWDPGIKVDKQLSLALRSDGLPTRTTVYTTLNPGANIQTAINNCPEGQVVLLSAGTFTISATLQINKGVVLRGAGSQGGPTGTTIVKTGGQTVLAIGADRDATCYGGTGYALTQDGAKDATTITVGAATANFVVGDLALVDLVDDSSVQQGDCPYFKRVGGRSASQRVEIAAVDAANGRLTLSSPLHWSFRSASPYLAQIVRVTRPVTRWAGIENLRIQGGTNPGYDGQMAGGIDISNAAYCWVKDVQTDSTIGGMHVCLTGTYRCVVRDGYFHHSANYGFGADCYGIVLRCGSAENLIENNIVRYMNKPIMFNVTGGGNVIAYNYADNSWATPPAWQEVNIDCHCSFPHMELMEGNEAPHMGASTTHGNAGYLTYFRNYASSQFALPAVYGSTVAQTGNVTTLEFDGGDIGMNVVGNVLGAGGVSTVYDAYSSGPRSIYELGSGGSGATDIAATSLVRQGNFDVISNRTMWYPANAAQALPASLYLRARPAWWPAATPWPWVGPDLAPMVGVLPAKDRALHMP
jgi:hypothetical protein